MWGRGAVRDVRGIRVQKVRTRSQLGVRRADRRRPLTSIARHRTVDAVGTRTEENSGHDNSGNHSSDTQHTPTDDQQSPAATTMTLHRLPRPLLGLPRARSALRLGPAHVGHRFTVTPSQIPPEHQFRGVPPRGFRQSMIRVQRLHSATRPASPRNATPANNSLIAEFWPSGDQQKVLPPRILVQYGTCPGA